jgi:hypothetical protein
MNIKKNMLVLVSLTLFASLLIVGLSQSDESSAEGDDLATLLENANPGDTVKMGSDMTLSRDATVKLGVVFVDDGYSLTIPFNTILSVRGEIRLTGDSLISGSLFMLSGSKGSIDGDVELFGSIESLNGANDLKIGTNADVTITGEGNSRMHIDGNIDVGSSTHKATISVRDLFITGTITIRDSSDVIVNRLLSVGFVPTVITDELGTTRVNGKISLTNDAYGIVYGNSAFRVNNLKNPSVSTQFLVTYMEGTTPYATEYINTAGKSTLALPSAQELIDFTLVSWKNSASQVIPDDNSIVIGSTDYKTVYGETVRKNYTITLTQDDSIRWLVNGTVSSGQVERGYGTTVTIDIRLMPGYTELPSLKMNGLPYEPGTSFIVTRNALFTTSTDTPAGGIDMITVILALAILAIIILIVAVVFVKKKEVKNV